MSQPHLRNWDKEHRQEEQPLSRNTLSRSRPEKEDELMGKCCKLKIRLRLERKEEWSRHTFEVATYF